MEKALKALKQKTEKLILNSEYRSVKLHGVSCSRADLEIIVMYADTLLKQGNINGLMEPCGNVKEVFVKANIKVK